jgi:large subunit ribosomal protein L13
MKVIDANGLILGRLASVVAKELLQGEEIVIVNAEKCVISGDRQMVLERYREKRERGSREKGPYYPRMPDRIVKRTVRGMLPYKKARGREALSKLKVYIGVPSEFEKMEKITLPEIHVSKLEVPKYVVLEEISRMLGAKI